MMQPVPPDRLDSAIQFVELLRAAVHEHEVPANIRNRAAGSCLAISREHHKGIVLLIEHQIFAPAFALLRVEFEAYVRGEWLALCATDDEVSTFVNGGRPPEFNVLVKALEETSSFEASVLSLIKRSSWDTMCGYTHTGGIHIQRWNTPDSIEANYGPEEVLEVLYFAETIGGMCVIGMAALSDSEALAVRVGGAIKANAAKWKTDL